MRILIGLLILVFANTSAPFSRALSTTQERKSPVVAGTEAPDFTLKDQHGRQIKLSESRGKNPVVLVFYRGYW
jgi:cytochrome oxidase Cu insertion factor (SCO1/SenC/PrrC family)